MTIFELNDPLSTDKFISCFADHPFNLLVNGKFNQTVPAMIGVTKNEGGFFVLPVKGIHLAMSTDIKKFSSINTIHLLQYTRLENSFDINKIFF